MKNKEGYYVYGELLPQSISCSKDDLVFINKYYKVRKRSLFKKLKDKIKDMFKIESI